ncbi:MlaD family protein [Pelagibacterium luteolum]|uniref:Phospholipid/cholesterol/gamma-HCH transport system substrate-binding protein n=1 Tax=Pelagibacterium luteolum TaxID=440168 RepID=A0A1G7VWU9_9HYPH|nr:MlaD family protein [Pelagibacterium luteolum]SDG64071.1 phospholipid/cholesterol/gamma-HCH transport system substrate-binding protein [Pelagibacterium luteolum]
MENKANYAIVGAFVTLVVVGFMGFIYWFSIADSVRERAAYRIVFDGAVTGLGAGTNVLFNGIRVGTVEAVSINPDDPSQVLARIGVEADAPVMNDTRAILEVQGLTGIANIQLLGGSLEAGRLVPPEGQTMATMQGEASDFQLIMEGARDIIASAESTFARIETFFASNEDSLASTLNNIDQLSSGLANLVQGAGDGSDFDAIVTNVRGTLESVTNTFSELEMLVASNRESLTTTIANAETFSNALAANSDGINGFLSSMTRTADQIGPLSDELRLLTGEVRAIVAAVPADDVRMTIADIGAFAQTLAQNTENIEGFFTDARALASNLSGVSDGLQGTLELFDRASAAIDPQVIGRAMENIDSFSAALGSNAENVDRILANTRDFTETLGTATERVDTIIARVDEMVTTEDGRMLFEEIGATATSLRQLIDRVDGMVASDDGQNLFADFSAAANSIRDLSERLNAMASSEEGAALIANIGSAANSVESLANALDERTAAISNGITTFTNNGLGAYTTLANEAVRSLQLFNRVMNQIESNPQSLVFGGETVRDFAP